jgi:hypothetical protein
MDGCRQKKGLCRAGRGGGYGMVSDNLIIAPLPIPCLESIDYLICRSQEGANGGGGGGGGG